MKMRGMEQKNAWGERQKKKIHKLIVAGSHEGKGQLGKTKTADGRVMLKLVLKEQDMKMWTEFNWLRIGSSGELLWAQ